MVDQPKMDNLLHISWVDSRWGPHLNASNVLDYFSERSNPFYSRECNNEFIKMQQNTRIDQLQHMHGVEYMLLHAQDPILYIVRKQQRYSPTQTTPLAAYHIIGGEVYQTPDLGSVINSRLVSTLHHLNSSFNEMQSFSQYHPSRGYWWQTSKQPLENAEAQKKIISKTSKTEVGSIFQRRRVDHLLADLTNKFPYKAPSQGLPAASLPQSSLQVGAQQPVQGAASSVDNVKNDEINSDVKTDGKPDMKTEIKTEIKVEPGTASQRGTKAPPEKRQKTS